MKICNWQSLSESERRAVLERPVQAGSESLRIRITSYNVCYTKLLRTGADVVVSGRCADAALTLAPAIHRFGWQPGDIDLLSAGMAAGHILECGAQATGG